MKRTIMYAMLAIFALLVVIGCAQEEPIMADNSTTTFDDIDQTVMANNEFAIDMYQSLDDGTNLFISPYSISTALAMTYEGARGETADEMQSVLYYPGSDVLRRGSAGLYNKLNGEHEGYRLSTANALWIKDDYELLEDYVGSVKQYYGSSAQMIDFTNQAKAVDTINGWVEDETNDKIQDLLSPENINARTRLVLTNAIYFKGDWREEFEKKETEQREFTLASQEEVMTDMMFLGGERFYYFENDEVQVLELPYEGNEVSMLVVLPKENDLLSLKESLDSEKLIEWQGSGSHEQVNVFFPKFRLEEKYRLNDNLMDLGMPTAFSDVADFSGMTGSPELKIDFVIHQSFVEIDEKGTEAAAATAVSMTEAAAMPNPDEPKVFNADHPFLFFIKEKETDAVLFMGQLVDPRI